MTLLDQLRHRDTPHLQSLSPAAAMPDSIVDLRGLRLAGSLRPTAFLGGQVMPIAFTSRDRVTVRVPEGSISGDVSVALDGHTSNALPLQVAVRMADNLHPIANPAVDFKGNVYATFSGARGQDVPVSVYRIDREFEMRPFVHDLKNASGLAFGRDGYLYCTSRAEGTVYRISPDGALAQWAEGLGIATGLAFDANNNLYVGDRSGTIFKIDTDGNTFVFATLEPSVSAYHLAFDPLGTLLVTGPTTSSNEAIHAITPEGDVSVWYRGLGRPQGMAVDTDGNVYVAASLHGERGIVRITPQRQATVAISGSGLVGIAFKDDGNAVLATNSALYHVGIDVTGLLLQ